MNKYSSKAVKTAATVGMSLAMVLSNAAPVFAATAVTDAPAFCDSSYESAGIAVLEALDSDFTSNITSVKEIKKADKFTADDYPELASVLKTDAIKTGLTIDEILALEIKGSTIKVVDALSQVVSCNRADEDLVAIAKHLVRKISGNWTTFETLVGNAETALEALNSGYADKYSSLAKVTENYSEAKALYDELTTYVDYVDNGVSADAKAGYKNWDNFKGFMKDYDEVHEGSTLKTYIKQLEQAKVYGNQTVLDLVSKEDAISYKRVKNVETFIKNVKSNDIDTITAAKYNSVKDADEVVEYMDGLQAIVDEMKEAKDLLDGSNEAKKAYDDVADKVEALKGYVETRKTLSSKDQDDIDKADDDIEVAMNKFTNADLEAIQTYVEDVINEFKTVKARKLSSGNYALTLENATYGRYISAEGTEFDANLIYLLTTTVAKDEEESYYDVLIANDASTKDTLIKAATTDVKGITLGTNLTSAQAAKIVAAKNALDELDIDTDGKNPYGLTAKERRSVNNNRTLIETLYFKLIMNGTVTQSGWVDKGNGDWDYIAEDGSRPSKWVASGANWYYVKNGTMLRNSWIASDAQGTRWYYVDDNGVMVSNTTVNGYTFNSYGVWVK
ncbi:hypothetical protein [Dielma fastidiosa]|uniref:hypothetical protein n=1 Tax=Dielma fastidiosa TaxID=1034346 RepID=UPI000E4E47D4|nr:hypothetical protein [Dielma fastidiosa]RHN01756.1 hypothetical protein DWZ33_07120 [Dielma fastidiosa]